MSLSEEWQAKFSSQAPEHPATAKLVLDWYKQDLIKCQIIIDELERLTGMGEHAIQQNSIICKTWRGRRYEVTICKDGYLYENELYPNLTVIATKITGTHQSGNVFFGQASLHRKDKIIGVDNES